MSSMEAAVGEETLSKIEAIVRSYPEGITVEYMMEMFGFTNSNVIHAALKVLQERGVVQGNYLGNFSQRKPTSNS
jgi:SOS-response transcriptional repressor LexA